MKLHGIVVSCYRYDFYLTRLCVASIRLWYPDIPIWLLKDRHYGDFSTSEIERHWRVGVYPIASRSLGWGFGKLEVMTELPVRRLLLLDSDIVFAGRVLDRLEQFDDDFVVAEEAAADEYFRAEFYDRDRIGQVDRGFEYPRWGFNTGQVVVTTGLISKGDLEGLVDWEARKVLEPGIFKMGEQGVLNFAVHRKLRRGELTVRREPFMLRPGNAENVEHIHVADLASDRGHPELIHWAGLRWGRRITEMPRADILMHFEDLYYSRIPAAPAKRLWRGAATRIHRAVVAPARNSVKSVAAKLQIRPAKAVQN